MAFLDPVAMIYLGVLLLETMTGIFLNVFIIITIITRFNKSRRQDKKVIGNILLALAVSSICFVCMLLLNNSTHVCRDCFFHSRHLLYAIRFLILFTNFSITWLSSCLCFFYFVKIVNIKGRVFIWVRMNISKVITWMMLGSAMVSAMVSAIGGSLTFIDWTRDFSRNISSAIITNNNYDKEHIENQANKQKFFLFFNCAPFFLMVVTTVSTLISLKMHSQRMNSNLGSSASANTSGYHSVICIMVGFLMCYSLSFVITSLFSLTVFVWPQPGFLVVTIFLFSVSPAQSGFIIYGTPDLRKAWLQMIYSMKCNDLRSDIPMVSIECRSSPIQG